MKCHFCNAEAISNFELTSLDGYSWQWFLCMDCALICQSGGYNVKAKRKEKKVEENEERKEKESEKAI